MRPDNVPPWVAANADGFARAQLQIILPHVRAAVLLAEQSGISLEQAWQLLWGAEDARAGLLADRKPRERSDQALRDVRVKVAVADMLEHGLGLREAAKKHGIPTSTLAGRAEYKRARAILKEQLDRIPRGTKYNAGDIEAFRLRQADEMDSDS